MLNFTYLKNTGLLLCYYGILGRKSNLQAPVKPSPSKLFRESKSHELIPPPIPDTPKLITLLIIWEAIRLYIGNVTVYCFRNYLV